MSLPAAIPAAAALVRSGTRLALALVLAGSAQAAVEEPPATTPTPASPSAPSAPSAPTPASQDPASPAPPAPGATAPGAGGDAGSTGEDLRKQASDTAAIGLTAMKAADGDPHQAVDAAIAFSHALAIYDKLGDTDMICEMQADIFWCKKRMNLDNLQEYVAKKGATAQREFGVAQQVMDKAVPVGEAGDYLDRARHFREANPDDHFQNAIRFSEVIERFPDTDQAHQASVMFATEQSAYLTEVEKERTSEQAQLQQALSQAHATRFMQPPQPISATPVALPSKAELESALSAIHSLYKDAYARARLEAQKRSLARKLAKEAENSKDNPAAYHEMLHEAIRLAGEAEDYQTLLDACDHLAAAFLGSDAPSLKKEVLGRMKTHPPPPPSSPCSPRRRTRRPTWWPESTTATAWGAGTTASPCSRTARTPSSRRLPTWRSPPHAPTRSSAC